MVTLFRSTSIPWFFSLCCLILGCSESGSQPDPHRIDSADEWRAATAISEGTEIRSNDYTGGNFDVLGDGSLILSKVDSTSHFFRTSTFEASGTWSSGWLETHDHLPDRLAVDLLVYGQPQDMRIGWTKAAANPVVTSADGRLASEQSLLLPDTLEPNDQSLVRGTGDRSGKWLLLFNVGGWAVGGWAGAVADSLAPLKRGENPFTLAMPYPLSEGTGGNNAPNDFIEVDGTWYAPDESRDHISRMWTSGDLVDWTNQGPIEGLVGHDPGLVFDGERYHLFSEDDTRLQYASTEDPLGQWTARGSILDVGDHTGDADLSYFNNRWHMFFDDAPHLHYTIGYAETRPEDFPTGWRLSNDVFGPQNPDQGQGWDEDTEQGNSFGTGDADIAIEGTTLYMSYERPTGIAFKELELTDDSDQTVSVMVQGDTDSDGEPDWESGWQTVSVANPVVSLKGRPASNLRVIVKMTTHASDESPMLRSITIDYSD